MTRIEYLLLTGAQREHDEDCACPDRAFLLTFDYSAMTLDTDCACPDGATHLAPGSPSLASFVQTPSAHVQTLPNSHRLVLSPAAPGGPSVMNQASWQRWNEFAQAQPLREAIDYQLAEQALLQPAQGNYQLRYAQPETLTAWLHVTNACNLDCPYCYVRKSSARMSEGIGRQAIRRVLDTARQHGFKRAKLKYAGGEATLQFDLVRQLHEMARTHAQTVGIALREVVLSNGVRISPMMADWFAETQVKLMISLDGVGAVHDQQRPTRGGRGTFSQIEHSVDHILLPAGVRPDISVTLTGMNAAGAKDAVRWALDRQLPVSLNFYRQNPLSISRAELDIEERAIIDGMLAAYGVFEEILPEEPFLDGLLDRVQMSAHAHTCGVQHSYVVITHEGKLAQCQMHLDQTLGPVTTGDLLPLVSAGPIKNLPVDEKEGCRDCEFRYRCSGGCPLETYRATGRWDIKSPHCHIYKTLLPAALRLEGLRLLKTHGLLPS